MTTTTHDDDDDARATDDSSERDRAVRDSGSYGECFACVFFGGED
jgi:hypothetical protein